LGLRVPAITPTRVVFSQELDASTTLYSIPRAGGSVATLSTAAKPTDGLADLEVGPLATNSERLFVTKSVGDSKGITTTSSALQVLSNGTGLTVTGADAEWAFWSSGNDPATGIYGLQRYFLVKTSGANVQIKSYAAVSGAVVADLGVVMDTSLGGVGIFGSFGDKLLFGPVINRGVAGFDPDVYFLDAGVANSIRPISVQTGVEEDYL
jgi:hypothetical protein